MDNIDTSSSFKEISSIYLGACYFSFTCDPDAVEKRKIADDMQEIQDHSDDASYIKDKINEILNKESKYLTPEQIKALKDLYQFLYIHTIPEAHIDKATLKQCMTDFFATGRLNFKEPVPIYDSKGNPVKDGKGVDVYVFLICDLHLSLSQMQNEFSGWL